MLQVNEEYAKLRKEGAIRSKSLVNSRQKWEKARNDLMLAQGLLKICTEEPLKRSLAFPRTATFYDWVIVCSYYSIFHSAQALLGIKGIKIQSRVHHATLIAFAKQFVVNGELSDELFTLYEDTEAKAHELLDIIEDERHKRVQFQYHRLSRNNLGPARQSVENARTFLDAIGKVLAKKNVV
jgi:uncharacterized protein (UPF0332 family)